MIYTLDSWKDNEQQARLEELKNSMSSQLHQPDLSIKGGFLHASVLLVSASTKESIIPLSTLISSHSAYQPKETFVVVYCPNFITAAEVLKTYTPQLSLYFNYNCNIHICLCSDCQTHSPNPSTFYTLVFCKTIQLSHIKPSELPALLWDYTGPINEYEKRHLPIQRQGYINVVPVPAFILNLLPTCEDESPAAGARSQPDSPPPVFFAHLLRLFSHLPGFIVNINSTSPWPAIGALHASAPYILLTSPTRDNEQLINNITLTLPYLVSASEVSNFITNCDNQPHFIKHFSICTSALTISFLHLYHPLCFCSLPFNWPCCFPFTSASPQVLLQPHVS